MSVIREQASRYTLVNYFATAVAAISTLWIYPLALEAYGLAQVLVSISVLAVPFATLGTTVSIVKFFPEYSSVAMRNSYLFNVLVLCFGVLLLVGAITYFTNTPVLKLLEILGFNAFLIAKHKYVIVFLIGVLTLNSILSLHASNYHKIAIPSIFNLLIPKFVLPVLVLGVYFVWFDQSKFAQIWVMSFMIATIGHMIYTRVIGAWDLKPRFTFFSASRLRALLSYSSYVGLSQMSTLLITRIDLVMVGTLIGLEEAALYGIALYIANILRIPSNAIFQIAAPVISKSSVDQDRERIEQVYKKTSSNLLVIGFLVFFCLLGTLDSILFFSSNYSAMQQVIPVFMILGAVRLVEMGTSVNQQIIAYSTKYRSLLIMVLITGIVNVVLTYVLIGKMGMAGAAWATLVSVTLFNLAKMVFIQFHFSMHPFDHVSIKLIGLLAMSFGFFMIFPAMPPSINLLLFPMTFVSVYLAGIWLFNIESDIVSTAQAKISRVLRR